MIEADGVGGGQACEVGGGVVGAINNPWRPGGRSGRWTGVAAPAPTTGRRSCWRPRRPSPANGGVATVRGGGQFAALQRPELQLGFRWLVVIRRPGVAAPASTTGRRSCRHVRRPSPANGRGGGFHWQSPFLVAAQKEHLPSGEQRGIWWSQRACPSRADAGGGGLSVVAQQAAHG